MIAPFEDSMNMNGEDVQPFGAPFSMFVPEGWTYWSEEEKGVLLIAVAPTDEFAFPPQFAVFVDDSFDASGGMDGFLIGVHLGILEDAENIQQGNATIDGQQVGWLSFEGHDENGPRFEAILLVIAGKVGYAIVFKSPASAGKGYWDDFFDYGARIQFDSTND
ncbi:MAG: hypothetical protein KDB14_30525 [Planctomycetales bacterium]|nr:hypothetical protein [Planctomycetales bacterium]